MQEQKPIADGKEIITETKPDGSKRTTVVVRRIDVEDQSPDTQAAQTVINDKIIPMLAKQKAHVVVIHKPTNESTSMTVPALDIARYVRAAIKAFPHPFNTEIPLEHFIAVVVHNDGRTSVTSAIAFYEQ